MYYKEYGNTGIKVSAVGFGGMRFNEEDVKAGRFEKCAEIPIYAFEKGINYWDTAPYYNEDHSETIHGIALSQVKRSELYISSKTNFGTLYDEPNRDNFRKRLESSLKRLQTDYIDFYHMWCMLNLESWQKHMEQIYRFFEDAKAEGLIRNIVFSSHMQGNDIEQVVDSQKFKGMLIGYNALNYRFRQSGINKAYESGMGVVAMNPLGGGTIPQDPEAFGYLTEGTDLTVAQAATRFVASHREITIALVGCETKEHVDDAVKAVVGLEERPAQEIVKAYETKGVSFNDLCTGCGYCKSCPVDIPIPKYMDAYNKYIFGKKEASVCTDHLKYHWGTDTEAAKTCIACGICEQECTQHLPIVERLKEISKM